MGRPSKLTENQWAEIGRRLSAGEKPAALAKEFKVSRGNLSTRFSKSVQKVKDVADQIVTTHAALSSLTVSEQIAAVSLADTLKSISGHLAGAANYGAATAHRLQGIVNAKVQEIDDADPLNAQRLKSLKGVAVLTRLANDSAQIGINLLSANKDFIREVNSGGAGQSRADELREIAGLLPN